MELKLHEASEMMNKLMLQVDEDGVITPEALAQMDDIKVSTEEKAK